MDKVTIILLSIVVIFIGAFAWTFHAAMDQNSTFNVWTARCNQDAGIVERTRLGMVSEQYECFKDGKIIDHEN